MKPNNLAHMFIIMSDNFIKFFKFILSPEFFFLQYWLL